MTRDVEGPSRIIAHPARTLLRLATVAALTLIPCLYANAGKLDRLATRLSTEIADAHATVREWTEDTVVLAQESGATAGSESIYALYNAYFRLVASGTEMIPVGDRIGAALMDAGVGLEDIARVRIGYSEYLDRMSGGRTAMTDCFEIYFPRRDIVESIRGGDGFREHRWLLHEIGHTRQCAQSGRQPYAVRWFREVGGTVVARIMAGLPVSAGAIHDTMPLEKEAKAFADDHLDAFEAATAPAE